MDVLSVVPRDFSDEVSRLRLLISSALSGVHTSLPVKVESVTNSGGVEPIGRVTVRPLVLGVTENGEPSPRALCFDLPYLRVQGGSNAVILDPEVGDIGLAIVCERDISRVLNTAAAALPGSGRMFDLSDGIYAFSILSKTPQQYVQFQGSKITIHSPQAVTIECQAATIDAPETHCTGNLTVDGNITAAKDISDQGGKKSMSGMRAKYDAHTHTEYDAGGQTSVTNLPM